MPRRLGEEVKEQEIWMRAAATTSDWDWVVMMVDLKHL
jgi:hypothetical protein